MATFIDLFAGAGGISEGFLAAGLEFLLASDINANCALTHEMRYNRQLGLPVRFVTGDVTEPGFADRIAEALEGREVDVVAGGPSCQSFSTAGRRRRRDRRDTLFESYLDVIRRLKPRYFIMENVKGILTKDGGAVFRRIVSAIRSIPDESRLPALREFAAGLKGGAALAALVDKGGGHEPIVRVLNGLLKPVCKDLGYRASKTDPDIGTVRRGAALLGLAGERGRIADSLLRLKASAGLDGDAFADTYADLADSLDDGFVLDRMEEAAGRLAERTESARALLDAVSLCRLDLDALVDEIGRRAEAAGLSEGFKAASEGVRLYPFRAPLVLRASDYGVPQDRVRVVFAANRRDVPPLDSVPPTVRPEERVAAFEALWDIEGGAYADTPDPRFAHLAVRRDSHMRPDPAGRTYAEWMRRGILADRFPDALPAAYVDHAGGAETVADGTRPLNHERSAISPDTRERLRIIAEAGGYAEGGAALAAAGLKTGKRNYTLLKRDRQSPTVVTLPDDFVHWQGRPPTVREMARLQSFGDDFAFQGKRVTGGLKRRTEVPQSALVGNAVPPLMARAIGEALVKLLEGA